MSKKTYRVGEGANLEALPYGTRVGGLVKLTDSQALYERDMGRLTLHEESAEPAAEPAKSQTPAASAEKPLQPVVPNLTRSSDNDPKADEAVIATVSPASDKVIVPYGGGSAPSSADPKLPRRDK